MPVAIHYTLDNLQMGKNLATYAKTCHVQIKGAFFSFTFF